MTLQKHLGILSLIIVFMVIPGLAFAQTAVLTAAVTIFPSVTPGEMNAPIAAITLNPSASGSNLNIISLPLVATYSNGLIPANLSNCRLTLSGSTLDMNGGGFLNAGTNTLTFNTPLVVTASGGAVPLFFGCNVASSAPVGGNVVLSLAPSGIVATNANNGTTVSATQGYDSNGNAESLGGTITIAAPVTTVSTITAPNTGAGAGAPFTFALLIGSALLALFGIVYMLIV